MNDPFRDWYGARGHGPYLGEHEGAMRESFEAGDAHGKGVTKAAVLDLIKNQRLYQSLYKQIEELE
jgi:hypothetical protein